MSSPISDPFDKDNAGFTSDLDAFNDATNEQIAAKKAYTDDLNGMLSSANPEMVFMALMMLLGNQGSDELNSGLNVQGAGLQVDGDLTQLNNDLQNLTHPAAGDTVAQGPQGLKDFTTQLDKMLDMLNGDPNSPQMKALLASMGSTAVDSLKGQLTSIRQDIYWQGDPEGAKYNPTSTTYHFNPDAPNYDPTNPNSQYLNSFASLQTALGTKGNEGAQDAAKLWTDAFNTNTSTTQSVSAADNELVTNATNTVKTLQAFVSAMMHSIADVVKSADQNMAKG